LKLKTLIPKSEARKLVVSRRAEISSIEIKNKTKLIINRLSGTDEFVYAKNVYCYINSRPGEVDTHALIDFMNGWGKSVILPKLSKNRKEFSRFHFMGWDIGNLSSV
jgi:5-formyltetrahydrofolate cyclo-ligase